MIDTFYDYCNVFDFGTDGVQYFMELINYDIFATNFVFTRQFTTFARQGLYLSDNSRHLRDKIFLNENFKAFQKII